MYTTATLGTTDFVLLGLMLAVSLGIGVFFAVCGNKQASKEEYLMGGRNLGAIPICLSLFATFQSAIALIGMPAEVYTYGTMILYSNVGTIISYLVTVYTLLPLLYPLNITSINEYLEMRYKSRAVRLLGALLGMLLSFAYMTMALLSPALALQSAVSIPLWVSLVVVGGVGTLYTAIGGIRSVIWTDVFQTFIIFGGLIFIIVKGSTDAGGMKRVWEIANESGRFKLDEWRIDPRIRHTGWGLVIGASFYWTSMACTQSTVQRLCATKSIKDSRRVLFLSIPVIFFFAVFLVTTGCVVTTYFFAMQCDPLKAGYITNRNHIMPYFVILTMGFLPGLSGVYMASIFAGALSTLSSGINSLAANTLEDVLLPWLNGKSESFTTAVTKALVCTYGVVIIVLASAIRSVSGPVTQVTFAILSAFGGPTSGLFFLSGIFPQANVFGALSGTILSLAACLWLSLGRILYGKQKTVLPSGSTDGCPPPKSNSTSWPRVDNDVNMQAQNNLTSHVWSVSNNTSNDGLMEQPSLTFWTSEDNTTPVVNSLSLSDDSFSLNDISYIWMAMIGFVLTIVLGLVLSLIRDGIKGKTPHPPPQLLFPFARRIWAMNSYNYNLSLNGDGGENVELDLDARIK